MISTRIAIFASGTGSNALKIMEHFAGNAETVVCLVVSNKDDAGVLLYAKQHQVNTLVINKSDFYSDRSIVPDLEKAGINFIVLAGFLWKVPDAIINAYSNRMINIHPALLPKYGGKGMYGSRVHEAVLAAGDTTSGITIHLVDEHYDNGKIIFQATCPVAELDTPETLADKIHALEHRHFAGVIDEYIQKLHHS